MELFNEVILVCTLYTIMCFSGWLSNADVKLRVGYVACSLVTFHFGLNLGLIFITTFKIAKRRLRMRKHRR